MTQRQPQQHDHLEPRQQSGGERAFYIVYPERMWVTESRIRGWAADAIANAEVEDYLDPATADIEDVIQLLHEEGNFTFTTIGDYS